MVILTDLSEVLIYGMGDIDNIIATRYNEEVARAFLTRHIELEDFFRDLLRGKMSEDVYWRLFLHKGSWPFGMYEIEDMLSENMRRRVPGTLSVYQKIMASPKSLYRPNGHLIYGTPEIYLVSDHISERIGELHHLHPDVFDEISKEFWSCESGQLKSDPRFFQQLLRATGLTQGEVIFIDDSAYNTTAAAEAGITSIYFKNAAQLQAELEEYGFVFT